MKSSPQVVKGRIQEVAGALSGNDRLRAKGQANQAVGRVRQVAEQGVRLIKGSVPKVADKA
jgi:uncharacterized protein YjbJ (UPF0337 family)